MTEDATISAAKMQPKCKKKAALRAVSEYYSDAMDETSSACMPRAEPKDTMDEERQSFVGCLVYIAHE